MSKLDEILAGLDEEEAAAIRAELDGAKAATALAERDLGVLRNAALRDKFPRAMAAYDKGRVTLPSDPSEEALIAYLTDKEEEYTDLGMPLPGKQEEPKEEPAAEPTAESDPAAAFGAPVFGGAPAPSIDYVNDIKAAINERTEDGKAKAAELLHKLNVEEGYRSPKLQQLVQELNAKPIVRV